jgi:hypothetical protein
MWANQLEIKGARIKEVRKFFYHSSKGNRSKRLRIAEVPEIEFLSPGRSSKVKLKSLCAGDPNDSYWQSIHDSRFTIPDSRFTITLTFIYKSTICKRLGKNTRIRTSKDF